MDKQDIIMDFSEFLPNLANEIKNNDEEIENNDLDNEITKIDLKINDIDINPINEQSQVEENEENTFNSNNMNINRTVENINNPVENNISVVNNINMAQNSVNMGNETIKNISENMKNTVENINNGNEIVNSDIESMKSSDENINTDIESTKSGVKSVKSSAETVNSDIMNINNGIESIKSSVESVKDGFKLVNNDVWINDTHIKNENLSQNACKNIQKVDSNDINHNKLHEYRHIESNMSVNNFDDSLLELNNEELELVQEFEKTFDSVNNNFSKYSYIVNEKEEVGKFLNKIQLVYRQTDEDSRNLKLAITTLKQWYNNHKENTINELQKDINYMLNVFFKNNHRIKLEQDVQRNNSIVSMIELDEKGNKIGDIGVILSGAEKQMTGFLIQSSILNTLGSNFVILDEAFSSFGVDEVKRLPEILKNLDNMQIVIIEHKEELYEDYPIKTYRLDRDKEKGTHVVEVINTEE